MDSFKPMWEECKCKEFAYKQGLDLKFARVT